MGCFVVPLNGHTATPHPTRVGTGNSITPPHVLFLFLFLFLFMLMFLFLMLDISQDVAERLGDGRSISQGGPVATQIHTDTHTLDLSMHHQGRIDVLNETGGVGRPPVGVRTGR